MMRRTCRRGGNFLTNQRAIADWWQPFFRQDTLAAAQARLQQAVDAAAAASTPSSAPGLSGSEDMGGDGLGSGEGSRAPPPPPPPVLSLYEANGLALTFASQHDMENLSRVVQYTRETLGRELAPFHYNTLLRTFNYHHDRDGVEQMLRFMAATPPYSGGAGEAGEEVEADLESGEAQDSAITPETYARVIDCLHACGPDDALARCLAVVRLCQEAFGSPADAGGDYTASGNSSKGSGGGDGSDDTANGNAAAADTDRDSGKVSSASSSSSSSSSRRRRRVNGLRYVETRGSEGAVVAAYGTGPARAAALADPDALPGPDLSRESIERLMASPPSLTGQGQEQKNSNHHIITSNNNSNGRSVTTAAAAQGVRGEEEGAEALEEAEADEEGLVVVSSPVLSSLLHHVCLSASCGAVEAAVVWLWICASGVAPSSWDTINLLSALVSKSHEWPRLRALLGSVSASAAGAGGGGGGSGVAGSYGSSSSSSSNTCPAGSASPAAVVAQLRRSGECEAHPGGRRGRGERRSGSGGNNTSSSSSSSTASALGQLCDAMMEQLTAAGVDVSRPVATGLLNARVDSLSLLLDRVLLFAASASLPGSSTSPTEATATAAGGGGGGLHHHPQQPPSPWTGVGPRRENAAEVYHALMVLHSSCRDDVAAARTFARAAELAGVAESFPASSALQNGSGGGGDLPSAGEPAHIGHFFLMDAGSLFARLRGPELAALRRPYKAATAAVVDAARARELSALSQPPELRLGGEAGEGAGGEEDGGSGDGGGGAEKVVTLATVAPPPSAVDLVSCESYCSAFLRGPAEAREALQRAIRSVDRTRARQPRATRLLFRHVAEYCCRHPPRNPKLSAGGLAQRRRWAAYLDARDAALTLFGSSQLARDSMRQIYYNGGALAAMRGPEMIARDVADVGALLFPQHDPQSLVATVLGDNGVNNNNNNNGASASGAGESPLLARRTSLPHTRCSAESVPRYLWDPAVYNPYPHLVLGPSPASAMPGGGDDGATAGAAGDFFEELWATLLDPAVMGADTWFVQNTDMYLALLRCLLHRLDWEAAAHLTTRMLASNEYTYAMDHEITGMFREIGDPAGCLAFKVATKLFDGRITRDGQTRREQYHQQQFS